MTRFSFVPDPSICRRIETDIDHLEIDIGFLHRIGGHRNEIIDVADLHAVAGVIEQRDIGAGKLVAKRLDRLDRTPACRGRAARGLPTSDEADFRNVSAINAASLLGLASGLTLW